MVLGAGRRGHTIKLADSGAVKAVVMAWAGLGSNERWCELLEKGDVIPAILQTLAVTLILISIPLLLPSQIPDVRMSQLPVSTTRCHAPHRY